MSTADKTDPGRVMGTIKYMSPEQARGLDVDTRTDIWSLGVVLYEMVTGRSPFEGVTTSDLIVSILEREPAPVKRLKSNPPAGFERIVMKALRKDTDERYQTIRDLAIDLRQLKRRLEVEGEIDGSASPEVSRAPATGSGREAVASTQEKSAAITSFGISASTSSVEYVVSQIKRHKKGAVLIGTLLLVAFVGMGYALYKSFSQPQRKPAAPFQAMKLAKLTNTGTATRAAISPDGKYIVHVMGDGGQRSLWLRNVATSSNVQIVPPAEVEYRQLTFSKDGNSIYYTKNEKKKETSDLYQVPVLGGDTRRIIANVGYQSSITFSPDGGRIAFVRNVTIQKESVLMIANADGTGERSLVTHTPDYWFADPAWSPDGKVIASSLGNYAEDGFYMTLIEVSVESGAEKAVSSQRWGYMVGVAWFADGSRLIINAREQASPFQIWEVSYPKGEARRITNDLNNYHGVSLTADSGALVTVLSQRISDIWIAPNGSDGLANQITTNGTNDTLSWTPDGKIVYSSSVGGNFGLWVMEANGTGQRQLSSDINLDGHPVVTPDGRYIIYLSKGDGRYYVWRMDINGSNPKQMTDHLGTGFPLHISPDGQSVIYTKVDASDKVAVWKVSINGGDAVRLNDSYSASSPVVSPDGKVIACFYMEEPSSELMMALIPFSGGQPVKTFDLPPAINRNSALRWTSDGRALAYIDTRDGVSNIWGQPIDGGKPVQLTSFNNERIFSFDWSREGKWLALSRGTVMNDVVLISNFK